MENNDFDDPRNGALTGWPAVEPDGSTTEPAPAPRAEPLDNPAPSGSPSAPAPSGAPPGSASEPVPGATWCKRCSRYVIAIGKGKCPHCATFLPRNQNAVKNPVNTAKRADILADLVVEFNPRTTMERAACENLASTLERLASTRPGSTDWSRLMNASHTLSTALRGTQPESTPTAYENFTLAQLVTRAEQLLAEARRATTKPRPERFVPPPPTPRTPSPYDPPVDTDVPTTPQCAYGCGPLERCQQVKTENPEAWAAIHFNDPTEVERRSRAVTVIMYHQLRKGML